MRVGIFTDTYPPFINGVSTSVKMLKNALEKKGHKVFVITVNDKDMKYRFDENNTVLRIPGIKTGLYDFRLTNFYPIRAINKIKRMKLDIIHSHTEFGIGTFARVISEQYNIPLVHTYHTMYEDYIYYITEGHFKKSGEKLVEYLSMFYCDKTADELIVPTRKTYELFKNKYNYNKDIHIIPTGIEIDRFYPENIKKKKLSKIKKELQYKKDDFIVIFVGRIADEKNIDFLLKAHKKLNDKYQKIKLLIVGDGPDLEKYRQYVKENNLENTINLIGKVSWEEVPYYYNLSKVFVTASKSETQGLTVIEGAASELPVLCIDDESFKIFLIDDYNGYTFKDEDDYLDKLLKLYNNEEYRKQLARQARNHAESFSSKVYAERVLKVYDKAIKNKKSIVEKYLDKVKFTIGD